ncbi:P1 family peptidase [Paracoccus sp. P2]|uniref:P1 family peptidase n=1 Tax=Paracoccus pantotrophus TaxID=82367 RepID=A0A7H9BTY5_PARPN|nr:P1 family peptidase [Paracoccus pantotrophus]MDF3853305.1 P1 family peptidase [Paracoccus pantotrophus]QLH14593.1 P1 family peptidase [Paracoccus pantotrophus]RDD98531.1 peptidase S58 family protein [Paracoccus pantotrophus]WGR64723.1 peptidase S58 family protein [Paracoccus pantotrophus]SFO18581.1 D-aminopeptidase [Paracoccus pantotrophus]
MRPGPRNLITDVSGLRVGNARDDALRSGSTVLLGEAAFACGVNVMGGAPGTRETELLAPDKLVGGVDALVLSGGSAFGLAACDGVSDGLRAMGRGFQVGPVRVPIVPGAIVFDLLNGGDKDWPANPYPALGRRALEAASADFALGSEGAGTGAMTHRWKGGLGSASAVLVGGITVGALVVVNALGSVTAGETRQFWAAPWELGNEFGGLGLSGPYPAADEPSPAKRLGEATTIAIVATDAALDKAGLTRLATAAQDGMARAIVPSHTPFDGDLVFAVSTGARPLPDPALTPFLLGHAAACTLARAIARGVHAASPRPGDLQPCWHEG